MIRLCIVSCILKRWLLIVVMVLFLPYLNHAAWHSPCLQMPDWRLYLGGGCADNNSNNYNYNCKAVLVKRRQVHATQVHSLQTGLF